MNLGGGVAYRVVSDDLDAIRAEIADAFRGHLTPAGQPRLAPARHRPEQGHVQRPSRRCSTARERTSRRARSASPDWPFTTMRAGRGGRVAPTRFAAGAS